LEYKISKCFNPILVEEICWMPQGGNFSPPPNAIFATFPNRPQPLSLLKRGGSNIISLLQTQTMLLIFQLFNFWLPDKNQRPLQANCNFYFVNISFQSMQF